jgi:hypothetical protein
MDLKVAAKIVTLALIALFCLALFFGCRALQSSALFYPTHNAGDGGLARWMNGSELVGFAREVPHPENIWLLLHGNAGQAADRVYALGAFAATDSVFIMEYPGYGERPGKPSRHSFDTAALEAYQLLRAKFPGKPVCVAGESIGSGPAAMLATTGQAPDKLVFIVPFDNLKSVGRDHMPYAPMTLLLAATWNNVEAIANYPGPIDVFGAERDEVIDVRHARALAASRPQAKFHLLRGAHNDWSMQPEVRIRNP